MTTTTTITTPTPISTTTALYAASPVFQQLPGESDLQFIKRMTATPFVMTTTNNATTASTTTSTNTATMEPPKPKTTKGNYQPIEEWDAERKSSGEMTWEETVQFEGQRLGNQVRQNDILNRNLHTF
jgi:hypothetical protein